MIRIILSSQFLLMTFLGFSQISPVAIGPTVGISQPQLLSKVPTFETLPKTGWQGGAFVRLTLKKFIAQAEGYISIKSGSIDFEYVPTGGISTESLNATQEFKLTQANVPVYLGRQLFEIPLFKIRAYGGPMFTFPLSSSVSISKNEGLNSSIPATEVLNINENFQWSPQLGLGFDVWNFTLDARYNFGIQSIALNQKVRQNYIMVTLGYKFLG